MGTVTHQRSPKIMAVLCPTSLGRSTELNQGGQCGDFEEKELVKKVGWDS
jgi:hypothetical protein